MHKYNYWNIAHVRDEFVHEGLISILVQSECVTYVGPSDFILYIFILYYIFYNYIKLHFEGALKKKN